MPYTTKELIEILDRELKANWKGERILLSSADRLDIPVISQALNMEKVSKVFAYRDFRSQIHQYQEQYQISGVIWRESTFNGQSVRFPEIHNQLIPISGDKAILMSAKASVIDFWRKVTQNMNFWIAGNKHQKITSESLEVLIQETEWAEIDAGRNEVYLGLCWGNPQEFRYQWAKPTSGCHRIISTFTEPSSINVH